jgi:hypothetical protein
MLRRLARGFFLPGGWYSRFQSDTQAAFNLVSPGGCMLWDNSAGGHLTTTVLIPSFRRPHRLVECLLSLARQTCKPAEVIVVWQANDHATREAAENLEEQLPYSLRIVHQPEVGIVPAENRALAMAAGEIILLIDDDAIAPPHWIARHLSFYSDARVGAVGGPAVNFKPDGTPFPKRAVEPVGKLTWYGRGLANLYDHIDDWSSRPPQEAESLVGYNMSLRRNAFDRFEDRLKPYWQFFELEACMQVKARGHRVLVDFANVVEHHPTNTAYTAGRDGDLTVKVYHAAYNQSFILAKHSPWLLRPWRLLYLLAVGSVGAPGLVAFLVAVRRHGNLIREAVILMATWRHVVAGWREGARARSKADRPLLKGQSA